MRVHSGVNSDEGRSRGLSLAARLVTCVVVLAAVFVGAGHPRNGFRVAAADVANTGSSVPACPPANKKGWEFREGFHAFRIWYPKDSSKQVAAKAGYLKSEMDNTIWPKLTQLMHTAPLAKPQDICMVNSIDGSALGDTVGKSGCDGTEAKILMLDSIDDKDSRDVLAHEFMHSLQYSLDVRCAETWWWRESTGEWAEDYVYPEDNREHGFAHNYFSDMDKPLPDQCDCNKNREYGSYVFPFFLARNYGAQEISTIWHKAEAEPLLMAIDDVIPGGFKKQWPRFALDSWNEGPVDYFNQWDGLQEGVAQESQADEIKLAPGSDAQLSASSLSHLSAEYFTFKVGAGVRTVTFFNDSPYSGGPSIEPDPHAKVQALVSLDRGSEEVKDWTGRVGEDYCLGLPNQHVTKLTLIFTNSSIKEDFSASIGVPRVIATNVGCSKWTGHIDGKFTRPDGGILKMQTDATFKRQPSNPEAPLNYSSVSGGSTWKASGTTAGGCTYSGSGSWPVRSAGLLTMYWNIYTVPGVFNNRGYTGGIGGPLIYSPIKYTCTNGDHGTTGWTDTGAWRGGPSPTVSASGLQLKGKYTENFGSDGRGTWSWNLASPG